MQNKVFTGVISKSKKDKQYNVQNKKKANGQIKIYLTLHIKLKIDNI